MLQKGQSKVHQQTDRGALAGVRRPPSIQQASVSLCLLSIFLLTAGDMPKVNLFTIAEALM